MGRTLVCDDDADIRWLLASVLAAAGHEIVEAGTVAGGLAALDQERFDLVVSDLGLPDGTGLDICRAASGLGARVVVVTANTDLALLPALQACVDVIVHKPFAVDTLLHAARQARNRPGR